MAGIRASWSELTKGWNPFTQKVEPQIIIDGAAQTQTQAGSVWSYGIWPAAWYQEWTGLAGAADNAVIYQSGDISAYNYHTIYNGDNDEAVDVHVSLDGTNFYLAPLVTWTAAGVVVANDTEIAFAELGILEGKFKAIKVLQKTAGAIAVDLVYGSHSVK